MNYGMVRVNFQLCSFNFTQFVSHGLTCSELCRAHIKRHILWKVRGLDISSLSFLIADVIVCFWYNDKFVNKGVAKFKSKRFSESWIPDCNLKFSRNFENLRIISKFRVPIPGSKLAFFCIIHKNDNLSKEFF